MSQKLLTLLYPPWKNNSHNSRECNFLNTRDAEKDDYKYGKKDYKRNFKEINLLQSDSAHQKSKYENINKPFTKSNNFTEETVNLDDSSDRNSLFSSDSNNSSQKIGKPSIDNDSDSSDNGEISSSSTSSEDNN